MAYGERFRVAVMRLDLVDTTGPRQKKVALTPSRSDRDGLLEFS
jgi:hypothetical protein